MTEVNNEIEETEEVPMSEQMEKMQAALDRYKKENEKFRQQRDEWKSKYEESLSSDEVVSDLTSRVTKAEAKLLLQKEGIKDADRIVNRMDFSTVSLDEDGSVSGLEDQISSLKSDLPELFDHKRRIGGAADGSSQGSAPTLTPTEQAVRKIFNR